MLAGGSVDATVGGGSVLTAAVGAAAVAAGTELVETVWIAGAVVEVLVLVAGAASVVLRLPKDSAGAIDTAALLVVTEFGTELDSAGVESLVTEDSIRSEPVATSWPDDMESSPSEAMSDNTPTPAAPAITTLFRHHGR